MSTKTATTAPEHQITIPEGLPPLEGSFTRHQRVEIALDVIATLKSTQKKLELSSTYFAPERTQNLPKTGQLNSRRIKGKCFVCARGMLFIKSLDRYDSFELDKVGVDVFDVTGRTEDEWGEEQAELIEAAFEGYGYPTNIFYDKHVRRGQKALLIAICENIIANHGEFRP